MIMYIVNKPNYSKTRLCGALYDVSHASWVSRIIPPPQTGSVFARRNILPKEVGNFQMGNWNFAWEVPMGPWLLRTAELEYLPYVG